MRIGERQLAGVFRAHVFAGPLTEADEEALLGREAVDIWRRHTGVGLLPGDIGQDLSTQVSNVFTNGQLAVQPNVVDHGVFSILIDDALRLRGKTLGILLGPPILQVAVGVVLPARIVESVRQFVADRPAGIAIVRRIIERRIVERRLQDSCRKIDVVHLRVEIGVDGRRRHVPLVAIDRPTDLGQLAIEFESSRASHVADKIAGINAHHRVVTPMLGIADLVADRAQLAQSRLLGGSAHPRASADALGHDDLDSLHHVQHRLLGRLGEGSAHVSLAQRLTQLMVDRCHATLPARRNGLRTREYSAVEIEVLGDQRWRQIRRLRVKQMKAQIHLPDRQRLARHPPRQLGEELRRADVDPTQIELAESSEVARPRQ